LVPHGDIGHLHAPAVTDGPLTQRSEQIVKLNDGRWAVVLGNGVNSANERPVLLIQYLDGDRALRPIEAPVQVLWGARDRHLGIEFSRPSSALVPDLRYEVIEDASHWVQVDRPASVNARLKEFLDPLGPSRVS